MEKGLGSIYKRGIGFLLYICTQSCAVAVDNCHERLNRKMQSRHLHFLLPFDINRSIDRPRFISPSVTSGSTVSLTVAVGFLEPFERPNVSSLIDPGTLLLSLLKTIQT